MTSSSPSSSATTIKVTTTSKISSSSSTTASVTPLPLSSSTIITDATNAASLKSSSSSSSSSFLLFSNIFGIQYSSPQPPPTTPTLSSSTSSSLSSSLSSLQYDTNVSVNNILKNTTPPMVFSYSSTFDSSSSRTQFSSSLLSSSSSSSTAMSFSYDDINNMVTTTSTITLDGGGIGGGGGGGSSTDDIVSFITASATASHTIDRGNILFDGLNIGSEFNLSSLTGNWSSVQQQKDIINNRAIQTSFCLLYTAIFILGIFGNVLVCFVVFRNKAMQTVTNLFITNLAVSDIFLCLLAVPITPLYTFLQKWIFGTILCHLVPFAQGCSVYVSTLTLTAIAIDRFFVIIYPFQQRMRLLVCIIIILIIWTVSLLLTLPYGIYTKIMRENMTDGQYRFLCEEAWPSEYCRKIYGTITSTLQFLLPFTIVSFCYICVSIRLNDRAKMKPGTKTTKKEELDRERKKRTNRMLIAMVMVFGISWLPLNVVNMLNDFYTNTADWKYYNLIFFISHSIAMSSTCYNPFLYAWLNDNFRKEFKLVLPCFNPSTRARCLATSGSQKWLPELTCNGNNETIQESLLTSSCTRGGGLSSIATRESIQLNGIRSSASDHLIFISDIEPPEGVLNSIDFQTSIKQQRNPETVLLPSGVLETNFEDPIESIYTTSGLTNIKTVCNDTNGSNSRSRLKSSSSSVSANRNMPVNRIRFDDDVTVASGPISISGYDQHQTTLNSIS